MLLSFFLPPPSPSSQSVQDYKPYSTADLPISIFGDFYKRRQEERTKFLLDIRERILQRVGTHPQTQLTLDDIMVPQSANTLRYVAIMPYMVK